MDWWSEGRSNGNKVQGMVGLWMCPSKYHWFSNIQVNSPIFQGRAHVFGGTEQPNLVMSKRMSFPALISLSWNAARDKHDCQQQVLSKYTRQQELRRIEFANDRQCSWERIVFYLCLPTICCCRSRARLLGSICSVVVANIALRPAQPVFAGRKVTANLEGSKSRLSSS